MKQATALLRSYFPPDQALLDQSARSGSVSFDVLQPGQVVRLDFRNYRLPGDVFSVTLNTQTNRLLEIGVRSYMGDRSKPVDMASQMGTLNDGAIYPARTELQLPSSNIEVDVVNTGYRKM